MEERVNSGNRKRESQLWKLVKNKAYTIGRVRNEVENVLERYGSGVQQVVH